MYARSGLLGRKALQRRPRKGIDGDRNRLQARRMGAGAGRSRRCFRTVLMVERWARGGGEEARLCV